MFLLLDYFFFFFFGVLVGFILCSVSDRKINLKAFCLRAYTIARGFWKDYFAKGPYLVLEGDNSTSITNLLQPEEVLIEILARLPVKSLLRFRLVCRSWRDIIKEPTFITKHHLSQVALNDGNCIFARSFVDVLDGHFSLLEKDEQGGINCTKLELPLLKGSPTFLQVAGPCNGIVVISDGKDKLFLWNPATREYKALPPSTQHSSSLLDRNSPGWWSCVGFGIDPRTKDYKVVRVWHFDLPDNPDFIGKVEVISLSATNLCRPKSETWKIIPVVPPTYISATANHIYANGKCYWLAAYHRGLDFSRLVWFDMGSEVFGKIELPTLCCVTCFERLVVLKGCVMLMRHACTVQVEEENIYAYYELSTIDDDGRLTKYATVGPFMLSDERPMGLWKNQELIMWAKSSAPFGGGVLIFYDINTNVIKSKTEGGFIESDNIRGLAFNLFDIYNESLISFGG